MSPINGGHVLGQTLGYPSAHQYLDHRLDPKKNRRSRTTYLGGLREAGIGKLVIRSINLILTIDSSYQSLPSQTPLSYLVLNSLSKVFRGAQHSSNPPLIGQSPPPFLQLCNGTTCSLQPELRPSRKLGPASRTKNTFFRPQASRDRPSHLRSSVTKCASTTHALYRRAGV